MKKSIETLKKEYEIKCMMNGLPFTEQGFKGYVSDQRMLERIRRLRAK